MGMGTGAEAFALWIGCIVFAYVVLLRLPSGIPRVIALLPWIGLLCRFAWNLPTAHMRFIASGLFVWIIPSWLLLLCWNAGPARDSSVRTSFPRFFATMVVLIHFPTVPGNQDSVPAATDLNRCSALDLDRVPFSTKSRNSWLQESLTVLAQALIKQLLLVLLFAVYEMIRHRDMPEVVVYAIYIVNTYLAFSLHVEVFTAVASAATGQRLELVFSDPYLASSITEFWGRRWNRPVSGALRASVYEPVLALAHAGPGQPPRLLRSVATMAVFIVSGLMHELIFFYVNKSAPTWEVTGFFVVNGIAVIAEAAGRRCVWWSKVCRSVPKGVRVALTVGFVFWTAALLFFPPIHRMGNVVRMLDEAEQLLLVKRRE